MATHPMATNVGIRHELQTMGNAARPHPAAPQLAGTPDRRLGCASWPSGSVSGCASTSTCSCFHAPNLDLPDRDTLLNELVARQMLVRTGRGPRP